MTETTTGTTTDAFESHRDAATVTAAMRNAFQTCAYRLALGVLIAALSAPHAASGSPADPIEGRIREVGVIDGVRYATVTVGSDDGVTRGTRLRVYGGRAGREVLGTVNITVVQPEESMGRVIGPSAAEVRADDRVGSEEKVMAPPRIVSTAAPTGE